MWPYTLLNCDNVLCCSHGLSQLFSQAQIPGTVRLQTPLFSQDAYGCACGESVPAGVTVWEWCWPYFIYGWILFLVHPLTGYMNILSAALNTLSKSAYLKTVHLNSDPFSNNRHNLHFFKSGIVTTWLLFKHYSIFTVTMFVHLFKTRLRWTILKVHI